MRRSRPGWPGRSRTGTAGRSPGTAPRRRAGSPRPASGSAPSRSEELFSQVARPVADMVTAGAFLGRRRLMSIDGMEWDVPDTAANAAFFGYPGTGKDGAPGAFPKARVVTVNECASHAAVLAAIGPAVSKGSGEQSLARDLYPRLEEDWLLIADRNFYNWQDWCTAAGSGAALLWRVKADLILPVLELLPDGSYRSVLVNPKVSGTARKRLIEAARNGGDLDPGPGPARPRHRVRGPGPRRAGRADRPGHHHHGPP